MDKPLILKEEWECQVCLEILRRKPSEGAPHACNYCKSNPDGKFKLLGNNAPEFQETELTA